MCSSDGKVVSVSSATWRKRGVGCPVLLGSSPVVTRAIPVSEKRVVGRSSGVSSGASSLCRDKASAAPFLWPGQ